MRECRKSKIELKELLLNLLQFWKWSGKRTILSLLMFQTCFDFFMTIGSILIYFVRQQGMVFSGLARGTSLFCYLFILNGLYSAANKGEMIFYFYLVKVVFSILLLAWHIIQIVFLVSILNESIIWSGSIVFALSISLHSLGAMCESIGIWTIVLVLTAQRYQNKQINKKIESDWQEVIADQSSFNPNNEDNLNEQQSSLDVIHSVPFIRSRSNLLNSNNHI